MNNLKINAALNVIKQLVSMLVPLITFPYVSRVLGVECYGRVNYTASIISYIALIAGLGITNYAIREGSRLKEDTEKFSNFVNEIFTLNFLALCFAYIVLLLVILFYGNNESYRALLLIQAISVFFSVIGCEWLNVIYEDYLFITIRYIFFQAITVSLTFLLVKTPNDILLYAIVSQIGAVFANTSNIIHFYHKWNIKLSFSFNTHIFSHLKYVLVLFGNSVSMLIYVNSDITLLGVFCGEHEVGLYSVAVKIYTVVKQLLNAVLIVGLPKMSRWTGKKSRSEVDLQLNNLLGTLLLFLIPATVGLFSLSGLIVNIMAGESYGLSSCALKILSVTLLFSTGVCFYSNLVMIPHNMEKYILKATLISALLNIILNLLFIPRFGMIAAAITTLLSEGFSVLYMVRISRKIYFPKILKFFTACIISGIIVFLCCNFSLGLGLNELLTVVIAIGLSLFVWLTYWLLLYLLFKFYLKSK